MSSRFFCGDYDYTESTRCVDNMIEQFEGDRKNVVASISPSFSLWKNNSILSKDDSCLFEMGKRLNGSIEDILNSNPGVCDSLLNFYVCPQCKNMRRLVDFPFDLEEPFPIECGESAGKMLKIEETNIPPLYISFENMPLVMRKALSHPSILDVARCSSSACSKDKGKEFLKKYEELSYLATDSFTNNLLNNWYLSLNCPLPNISKHLISWICNDKGYDLFEYDDIPSLSEFQNFPDLLKNTGKLSPMARADDKIPLSKEVVFGIILQLFAILHFLRKFDFSHGNPSSSSLSFRNEPASYIIDGIHVTSPITLKLRDFSHSGSTVLEKNIRIYHKSVVGEEALKKQVFEPIVETISGEVMTYRLKDPKRNIKASSIFIYMKHLGLPVYSSSFDAYAFMVLCMTERAFHSTVMSSSSMSKFWKDMWVKEEEYFKINERISYYHDRLEKIESEDILSILSGVSLRCDMIDFGWEQLKKF